MPSYYVYLISSLPSLNFGVKAPISFDEFMRHCEKLIPGDDLKIIKSVENIGHSCVGVKNETLKRWIAFETMLRNGLVKVRAPRKKVDPEKYLRKDGCPESAHVSHMAVNAYRKPSLLEGELALDADRRQFLGELEMGHYFDIDTLIIYACKLLMLEKWDKIRSARAERLLEEVMS